MLVEKIDISLTEEAMSYEALLLDEVVDGVPYKHKHRGNYHNTISGQQVILQDEILSDEQKQKILNFWGEPLPNPEPEQE